MKKKSQVMMLLTSPLINFVIFYLLNSRIGNMHQFSLGYPAEGGALNTKRKDLGVIHSLEKFEVKGK